MYVEDDGMCVYKQIFNYFLTLLFCTLGHTAPIEKEIRALGSALEAVKDEQEYIVVRERLHRNSKDPLFGLVG